MNVPEAYLFSYVVCFHDCVCHGQKPRKIIDAKIKKLSVSRVIQKGCSKYNSVLTAQTCSGIHWTKILSLHVATANSEGSG